ncbi:acyl-CoA carboxylase epsilon subunit [Streptosporangium sp. KLBMP 9127]|nr:acyl-CoA carboxylase subunit epsilon [Streptosporangium sp. KLBMP 9127]
MERIESLTVLRGNPTSEEVAAVIAAVNALAEAAEERGNAWSERSLAIRGPLRGEWRLSAWGP